MSEIWSEERIREGAESAKRSGYRWFAVVGNSKGMVSSSMFKDLARTIREYADNGTKVLRLVDTDGLGEPELPTAPQPRLTTISANKLKSVIRDLDNATNQLKWMITGGFVNHFGHWSDSKYNLGTDFGVVAKAQPMIKAELEELLIAKLAYADQLRTLFNEHMDSLVEVPVPTGVLADGD